MSQYDKAFYDEQIAWSVTSAQTVVPYLCNLLPIQSVVDLGCGLGPWLAAFRENGVTDIAGYDGDYVPREFLRIPQEYFHPADLARPMAFDRRYDLAISLEVAEHLPPEAAAGFVEKLTNLADVVLFSGSIPYQGGTGHFNENYPEYWAILFASRGYEVVDVLRDVFWTNGTVCPWYRQNMLLFLKKERLYELFPGWSRPTILTRIHPEIYLYSCVRDRSTLIDPAAHPVNVANFYKLWEAYQAGATILPESICHYGEEYHVVHGRSTSNNFPATAEAEEMDLQNDEQ